MDIINNLDNKKNQKIAIFVLYAFVAFSFLYRLFYANKFGLVADESYYWLWSQHLSLGYYDSGAILGWVIRFTTDIFGHSELAVRMTSVVLMSATSIILYLFAINFIAPILAVFLVIIFNLTPGGLLVGILMMHDSLMLFFWLLTVFSLYKAIFKNQTKFWYIAGICAGFGLWSKDIMYLILPFLFVFLIVSKEYRFWLAKKEPYLAFIIMLAVFSPILYWNYTHDWVTYRHIFALGSRPEGMDKFKRMGDFLGSQLGLISPFIFIGILSAWIRGLILWFRNKDAKQAFLIANSAFVVLFFFLLSSRSKVEGNWAGFGYLLGLVCYFYNLEDIWRKAKKTKYLGYTIFATLFSLILVLIILNPIILYKIAYKIPNLSEKTVKALKTNRTNDIMGWNQYGKEIRNFKEQYFGKDNKNVFIFSLRYQVATQTAFYYFKNSKTERITTYCLPLYRRMNQLDIWWGLDELKGKDGIFIFDGKNQDEVLPGLSQYFDSVVWVKHFMVYREDLTDEPAREYNLYVCKNFKGMEKKDFLFF